MKKINIDNAVDDVKKLFDEWVFKSIESSYRATSAPGGGTPMVAFMLVSCAIDVIAGFYSGRSSFIRQDISGQYKEFVKDYMKPYNPNIVYEEIRCSLVHNFIPGKSIKLTHNNPQIDFFTQGDFQIKNFDNFFFVFQHAVNEYITDLRKPENKDLRKKFIKRYKLGIPRVQVFNYGLSDIKDARINKYNATLSIISFTW